MFCEQIDISNKEKELVKNYCEQIYNIQLREGSRDNIRNDFGPHRLTQGLIGKYGEVGACKIIGGEINYFVWDKTIRTGELFDADIFESEDKKIKIKNFKNKILHVKTCGLQNAIKIQKRIMPKLNASWTVDIDDPIFKNPSLDDIIILMFSSPYAEVYNAGYIYAYDVKHLWKPCQNIVLQHKRAIYYQDIIKYIKNI